MHPIISRLLARKDLKVPVNDGRRVALVLFGGLMVGVRGAGSLTALQELGLTGAFDEIYAMSTGFSNGSSFLAGEAHKTAAIFYNKLSGCRFLNPLRVWKIADIDYLLEVVEETSFDFARILASRTKLYSMLVNVSNKRKLEFLEAHDYGLEGYGRLLRASFSVKLIGGGSVRIGESLYRDLITDQAITDFFAHVLACGATDILVIYNYPWQRSHIHEHFPALDMERIYEICPDVGSVWTGPLQKFARFDTRREILLKECRIFGDETKKIFGSTEPVSLL